MREDLLRALDTLYHQQDENARKGADQWLSAFQKAVEAWQVGGSVLDSPTLANKMYDIDQYRHATDRGFGSA